MAKNAVEVEGLQKRFGKLTALEGISFHIPAGTIFGLLGPNGAGKTTAVRILATILRPDGGRANVLGHDVAKEPQAVRHQIGLAGQAAAVDPNLTGRENLRMIGILAQLRRKEAKRRAEELLERFDLIEAADRPVNGYSGGMRRRLDVAAALVARPPVLFLDEPTTGLDVQSRTQLWEVIRELVAEGASVLLTTQYLEEADRLADRIAVVDHGRVIANDTPGGLKSRLGGTVVEFGMDTDAESQEALSIVSRAVSDHPVREGPLIRFSSNEGPRLLVDVLRRLDAEGLVPATLSVREPSLDDVFLTLTGQHASDAAASQEATSEGQEGQPDKADGDGQQGPSEQAAAGGSSSEPESLSGAGGQAANAGVGSGDTPSGPLSPVGMSGIDQGKPTPVKPTSGPRRARATSDGRARTKRPGASPSMKTPAVRPKNTAPKKTTAKKTAAKKSPARRGPGAGTKAKKV